MEDDFCLVLRGDTLVHTKTGAEVKDPALLERCRAVKVPAHWTDVYYNNNCEAARVARGRDPKQNLQYVRTQETKQQQRLQRWRDVAQFLPLLPKIQAAAVRGGEIMDKDFAVRCVVGLLCHLSLDVKDKVKDPMCNILCAKLGMLNANVVTGVIDVIHRNETWKTQDNVLALMLQRLAQHPTRPEDGVFFGFENAAHTWSKLRFSDIETFVQKYVPCTILHPLHLFRYYHANVAYLQSLAATASTNPTPAQAHRAASAAASKAIGVNNPLCRTDYLVQRLELRFKEDPEGYIATIKKIPTPELPVALASAINQHFK